MSLHPYALRSSSRSSGISSSLDGVFSIWEREAIGYNVADMETYLLFSVGKQASKVNNLDSTVPILCQVFHQSLTLLPEKEQIYAMLQMIEIVVPFGQWPHRPLNAIAEREVTGHMYLEQDLQIHMLPHHTTAGGSPIQEGQISMTETGTAVVGINLAIETEGHASNQNMTGIVEALGETEAPEAPVIPLVKDTENHTTTLPDAILGLLRRDEVFY